MKTLIEDFKKNDLLHYSFQYYSVCVIQVCYFISVEYLHNPYYLILFVYGILPVLDIITPTDNKNPSEEDYKVMVKQDRFKIPVYLAIFLCWISYYWSIYKMLNNDHGLFFTAGILLATITLEATNFNMAHELSHKSGFMTKFVGTSSLLKSFNTHFLIEHNSNHHVWVSTPRCTASAKLNQSLFPFILQSMIGGYKHGWELENKRCEEAYGTKYSIYNFMFYSTIGCLLFPLTGYLWLGYRATILQIFIGLTASSFFETINYIEHYGLKRRFISPTGKYEKVNIQHSWNAPYRISNYLLFKLQRHSDHHENALKPYQILSSYEESPYMPQGYAVCFVIAAIPPIWFEVMNPLVEIYRRKEKPSKDLLDKLNAIIYKYVFIVNVFFFVLLLVSEGINRKLLSLDYFGGDMDNFSNVY